MTTPTGETLMYDAVEAIYNVVELSDIHIDELLSDLRLTRPLSDVVWVLDPLLPAITMSALAQKLRCEPSTATFLIDKLVEKGLVQRGSDAKDRRKTTVALTPTGISVRERQVLAMMTGSPLAKLTPDELRTLVELLEKALAGSPKKYRM
ncbi:MarR family winged helix-turn-helix transcriptional regulator [Streptomyces phaeochromogenes]|uniref:MarR family winged helix-turn-helix transcriptional regulator n=1 Tax=Streptomyces phaeochromogenes TaxID=1923 RepID=UPI0036C35BA9